MMHMFDNWIDQQHLKNYPFNFLGDFDKDHQIVYSQWENTDSKLYLT